MSTQVRKEVYIQVLEVFVRSDKKVVLSLLSYCVHLKLRFNGGNKSLQQGFKQINFITW